MIRRRTAPVFLSVFAAWALAACTGTSTVGVGVNQDPPMITSQPSAQTVAAGSTATFSVSASGASPLSFQWSRNGSSISGATSAAYTTPPTVSGDDGEMFAVAISNSVGSATSNSVRLTVTAPPPPPPPPAQGTDVTTYKNDLARTAQNLTESVLTTSNVSSATFGLRRNLSVTGHVDAQPLYLSQLSVGGAMHNVVFVATEHDMVYAFDSDTGATLWSVSVANGESVGDDHNCGQVSPEAGITATPVIDRTAGAHGTIFVVAMTRDGGGAYHHRLHALDVTTGAELLGGPVEVQATYPNNSGHTTFDAHQYKERPGLLLLNGIVYTMWSSHCDVQPYTAWIMGYNESSLAQVRVFNLAPNSGGAGPSIWMAGGAPAVDSSGNIYLLAANGVFETSLDANGFPNKGDYGNAFVKLSTAGNSLSVADYFQEVGEMNENSADIDLGSGSAMVLPDLQDGGGVTRSLAVGAGKDGHLYVVNRGNMGKYNPGSNNIWQDLSNVLPGGVWSTPAYFNKTVYYGDVGGSLKAFSLNSSLKLVIPPAQTSTTFGYPGTSPAISANGTSNAIVWASENSSPAVLHAYDASTLMELYNSSQAGSRDHCGNGNKFITPTIADGKVFLGTQNSVCVFGLLP